MVRSRLALSLLLTGVLMACSPAPASGPLPLASEAPQAPSPSLDTPVAPSPAAPVPGPTAATRQLNGQVFGLDGQALPEGLVTAQSLDTTTPYVASATLDAQGRYQLPAPPAGGTTLALEASRPGHTPRRRVVTLRAGDTRVDFGGSSPEAAPFFLSPYPEITRVEPIPDDTWTARDHLRMSLRLSEPLAPESAARLAEQLRLLPANREAGGGRGATDLSLLDKRYPNPLKAIALAPWLLAPGEAFRKGSPARARASWDASGHTVTFTFDAPLLAAKRRARYQIALVGDGQPLKDLQGLPLGTGPTGELGSWPAAGEMLLGAFRDPDPELARVEGLVSDAPAGRWAATHDHASAFWLPEDNSPPRLLSVDVQTEGDDTVVLLQFDEPLVAHDGSPEGKRGLGTGAQAADLAGLTFLVGERGKLSTRQLRDGRASDAIAIDPQTTAHHGSSADDNRAFRFAASAFVAETTGAAVGRVALGVDPKQPHMLRLTLVGRPDFFDARIKAIAARVEGMSDPADNRRTAEGADSNLVEANL
ncbi:MAG: carboxypeptidase regulatory-like domain-containing protein [Candidatus Sericytochromatia bacterium]|nr:carboxypeptidase regulatory-like domain-containing protein [Candidatus Sericytochromatia bacterium]